MRRPTLTVLTVALASIIIGIVGTAQEPKKAPEPAPGKRHALLVGVSKYPNLAERLQLGGSSNDVLLLRETLTRSCGFKPEAIRILSEAEGEKNPERTPTRANIQREFEELAKRTSAGDTVFISMSGHGSQQPEGKAPNREPEPDGLDELFLPRDVGKWNNTRGAVENAIVDDDLGDWLKRFGDQNVSVFILVDACHSGTVTRGAGTERMRQLDTEGDLGIPKGAIRAAELAALERERRNPKANKLRGFVGEDPPLKLADKKGFVAIYAAQACEPTVELELPADSPAPKAHGLLTYTFCRIVNEAATKSKKPLTYREIAQRIHLHYGSLGRTFPTPVIEGPDQDRQLFGESAQAGRSSMAIAKTADGYTLNAGSAFGVTPGTTLAVYPPPGLGEQLLGHVAVDSVSVSESKVSPVKFGQVEPPAELPAGAICKVVSIDFGDLKRKIGVDPLDDSGKPVSKETRDRLLAMVQSLDKPDSLVQAILDPKKADWLVRALPGQQADAEPRVVLVPAAGFSTSIPGLTPPAFGPPKPNESVEKWLSATARTIAKAENLKKICGESNPTDGDEGLKFDLTLTVNGQPVAVTTTNLHAFTGDKVQLAIQNPNRYPIDFSILYMDSNFAIDSLFPTPKRNEFNRLDTNQKEVIPPFEVNPKASSATEGIEYLIVLAVEKSTDIPVTFMSLSQPGLGRLRARADATGIERLLAKGCYGAGQTRAMGTSASETRYKAQLIPFTIHKARRPKSTAP